MAEIKIKKKRPIWPWIIGTLLVIAVLGYFYVSSDYEPAIEDLPPYTGPEAVGIKTFESDGDKWDQEVTEYLSVIEDTSKLGSDTAYTRNALIQLTEAVRHTAKENDVSINAIKINAQMDEGKARSVETSDPIALAQEIKDVGEEISTALATIQEEKFPDLADRTEKIRKTFGKIVPTTEISEQKEQIITFFKSCGDALEKMEPKNDQQ